MGHSLVGETKVKMARALATGAHGAIKQVRKYTGDPYIVHPQAVAGLIEAVPTHSWEMLCVAWLHDVLEDTGVDRGTIIDMFGVDVGLGVWYLTNVEKEAGNRARRHAINIERLAFAPDWVKTVKVADLMDNTATIVQHDPNFAPLYLKEKESVMEVLVGADRVLWQMTWEQLERSKEQLKVGAA
jgi:(p)ppGpp synthase/HD superfamily hydrolase